MNRAFKNSDGKIITEHLIKTIHEHKQYLSDIDGIIGDGDHGINMDKGFMICKERIADNDYSFTESLHILGTILLTEIGGSMGPLYGSLFRGMAKPGKNIEIIDQTIFGKMLEAGKEKVSNIGEAKVGDKTLMDTLVPAVTAYQAYQEERTFEESLAAMDKAAEAGWQSTKDMVAKVGRASRLGERSKGVLDAGATSCYYILHSFNESIRDFLR